MAWRIEYAGSVKRQLRKLDRSIAKRILDYLDDKVASLKDPRMAGKALTGPLGTFWRYRVGDYRVVVSIEDDHLRALVVRVAHRREAYRR